VVGLDVAGGEGRSVIPSVEGDRLPPELLDEHEVIEREAALSIEHDRVSG
jgi:hypothetical protein